MVKRTRVAWVATLAGLALGLCLFGLLLPAQAKTTSDQAAAILYWPKIVVDGSATDTVIRLGNTCAPQVAGNPCFSLSATNPVNGMKQAHCFYVDANSHCSNNLSQVCSNPVLDCGGAGSCVPGWNEIDFDIVLTKQQPLVWYASSGLGQGDFPLETPGRCDSPPNRVCTSDYECSSHCIKQASNLGSGIPPVPEDPFVGSLQCIEYDPNGNPPGPDQSSTTNTLEGEATIESLTTKSPPASAVDLATYSAVGVKYVGATPGSGNQLVLDGSQYDSCPTRLILDHLFDIQTPVTSTTDLTLVPCGNDFLSQTCGTATAQFVVFNEFEQRFSTSRLVDCFLETALSNIDTPDSSRSIFSFAVSGTLAGETYIHPVGTAPTGRGLVGVARLLAPGSGQSSAYSLDDGGSPTAPAAQPDIITIP